MTVLETQIGCITYANSALPWLPGARGWKRTSSGKRRLINGVCHSGQEVAVGVPHLCCLRSIRWNVRFQFIQPFSAFLGVNALSPLTRSPFISPALVQPLHLLCFQKHCVSSHAPAVCVASSSGMNLFTTPTSLVFIFSGCLCVVTCGSILLKKSEGSQDFRQILDSEAGRGIHPWSLPTLESNTELWSWMLDHVWLWA